MPSCQATALEHDPGARRGSVVLDDGTRLEYGAAAFDAGGLRLLRPGQRVRLVLDGPPHEPATTVLAVGLPSPG